MKVIDAIQEAMGPRYATLEDALNWWAVAGELARRGLERFCTTVKACKNGL